MSPYWSPVCSRLWNMDTRCCSESRTLGGRTSPENWRGERDRGITVASVFNVKCQLKDFFPFPPFFCAQHAVGEKCLIYSNFVSYVFLCVCIYAGVPHIMFQWKQSGACLMDMSATSQYSPSWVHRCLSWNNAFFRRTEVYSECGWSALTCLYHVTFGWRRPSYDSHNRDKHLILVHVNVNILEVK